MPSIIESVIGKGVPDVSGALERGESIDATDTDGRTALMHAVIEDNIDAVRLLLAAGASADVQDRNGYAALHFAAQDHRVDVANTLLEAGARVDPQDGDGNTPLGRAVFASMGRGDLIRILLRYGANRSLKNTSDVSPIDLARSIGNYDVAQFFND